MSEIKEKDMKKENLRLKMQEFHSHNNHTNSHVESNNHTNDHVESNNHTNDHVESNNHTNGHVESNNHTNSPEDQRKLHLAALFEEEEDEDQTNSIVNIKKVEEESADHALPFSVPPKDDSEDNITMSPINYPY